MLVAFAIWGVGAILLTKLLREPTVLILFLLIAWSMSVTYVSTFAHNAGKIRYSISIGATVVVLLATYAVVQLDI